ncbi:MAG: hypothetical protein ACHBN1_21005 [Heteroscytonema crispum UTEX LB 1556]
MNKIKEQSILLDKYILTMSAIVTICKTSSSSQKAIPGQDSLRLIANWKFGRQLR